MQIEIEFMIKSRGAGVCYYTWLVKLSVEHIITVLGNVSRSAFSHLIVHLVHSSVLLVMVRMCVTVYRTITYVQALVAMDTKVSSKYFLLQSFLLELSRFDILTLATVHSELQRLATVMKFLGSITMTFMQGKSIS